MPQPIWSLEAVKHKSGLGTRLWKLYCTTNFVSVIKASKLVTIKLKLVLDSISATWGTGINVDYYYIDDFYHMQHYNYAPTGDMVKCFILGAYTLAKESAIEIQIYAAVLSIFWNCLLEMPSTYTYMAGHPQFCTKIYTSMARKLHAPSVTHIIIILLYSW